MRSCSPELRKSANKALVVSSRIAEAGTFGNIFSGPVCADFVKPIGQSARLAHIDFVDTVVIDIANRKTLVPVHIDTGRGIHASAPVRIAIEQLLTKRTSRTKHVAGNVTKPGPAGGH